MTVHRAGGMGNTENADIYFLCSGGWKSKVRALAGPPSLQRLRQVLPAPSSICVSGVAWLVAKPSTSALLSLGLLPSVSLLCLRSTPALGPRAHRKPERADLDVLTLVISARTLFQIRSHSDGPGGHSSRGHLVTALQGNRCSVGCPKPQLASAWVQSLLLFSGGSGIGHLPV